jgi:hypothetical protein
VVLSKEKYRGYYVETWISLKNSNSVNKFKIKIKQNIIKKTLKIEFKKLETINFI